jgi:hypothetical protein
MSGDARAKIKLSDGREVWRYVQVQYRVVGTGRWISPGEAEALLVNSIETDSPTAIEKIDIQNLREKLLRVKSQIALDQEGGAKATSAARLVLNILREMEADRDARVEDRPWFVLGRELAEEVLALVREEQDRHASQNEE